jgi:LytS/YehU family sensor histidine kinase
MRKEWREYWRQALLKTRLIFSSLGIALVFFLIGLPETPAEKRWQFFDVALIYGVAIFLTMYIAFALYWALFTWRLVRTGRGFQGQMRMQFAVAVPGLTAGIWLAQYLSAQFLGEAMHLRSFMGELFVASMISLAWIMYNSYRFSREEVLKLSAANSEARYHVLENQMNPHFLFNSLNSLSELIPSDSEQAAAMAQKLSDLYREILANSKERTSTLRSELAIVNKYLQLESLRYGSRLRFDLPQAEINLKVPSLILQTLVENAIKHGIAKQLDGGHIAVRLEPSSKECWITVANTCGQAAFTANSGGTGLENTRQRLDLLYGDRHQFSIAHQDGETRARFRVPIEALV